MPGKTEKTVSRDGANLIVKDDKSQGDGGSDAGPSQPAAINQDLISEINRRIQMLSTSSSSSARDLEEARSHHYAFWRTQPVPQLGETVTENTYIEAAVDTKLIRQEPYSLPPNFRWVNVDLQSEQELSELYKLLNENYVEDDDSLFRFDYSRDFFKWALLPPGWKPEWHCGVRTAKNALVAFIGAIPCQLNVRGKTIEMVEINFLCVHKSLRSKRLAPVLIREITRRVNLFGVFQAAYTAGVVLPKPLTTSKYWHRSLNPKKLIECRFSNLSRNMTMQRTIRLYALPKECLFGFVPLEERHLESAFKLVTEYLAKFLLHPAFNADEFAHFFLPRDKVIYTYVIEKEGTVTDFISFYSLPSTVVNHPTHKSINAAYAFYNVATSISLNELIKDALICACREGFDVFNALDLMENKTFLEDQKFGIGDGNLNYYLYNWKCPDMRPEEVGLVLQ